MGWEDPRGKGMVTHSNILVWEMPWTEEPGGLQSMGVAKSLTGLSNEHFHFQGDMTSKNAMWVLMLDPGAEETGKKFW